jgi:succinate dehydrogenase / fumarate reductase cytochrome b subunit
MADSNIQRERPLSPHLEIYKPSMTMMMSILHRITGAALYLGTLILAAWLLSAATSAPAFATVHGLLGSWFGRIILLGYSWALLHHMLGGIRHLIWDTGHGYKPRERWLLATGTLVGSLALTLVLWFVAYAVR